jgi:transcriptional regulator with XRE-family HTH domain
MKERIIEFLKQENKSAGQFAEEIGVQPSSVSHILSGRNNPSLDFAIKMLSKYPYVSTDWLLFGKGEMFSDANQIDLFSDKPVNEGYDLFMRPSKSETIRSESINSGNSTENVDSKANKPGIEKKANRIVWFFEDGTFIEYIPG